MLSVLIATHNGSATLPRVLDGYCRLAAPAGGWELIIVDNASSDRSGAIAESYAGRLPLTCLYEAQRGKNAALNRAVPHARGDLLVFSDDDATPEPEWLQHLERCAAGRPDHAMFGGRILPDWEIEPAEWILRLVPLGQTYGVSPPDLADGPVHPGLLWGANMALRRAIFDAGHRFDVSIGPNGHSYAMGSETEFTLRLSKAGFRAWFCPAARVWHRIRAYQLETKYILARGLRFGRGMFRQSMSEPAQVPMLLGVPRWMLRKFLDEAGRALLATLTGDAERRFLARWELHYLTGFFREAQLQRRRAGIGHKA